MKRKTSRKQQIQLNTIVFHTGELVFAKMRGYAEWPSKIVRITSNKVDIVFFGTNQT